MERLTERTADGILVKENHGENGLRTFYQCFEEKPNDKYINCDGGYCAIEKLAAYEDAEEQGQYGKWIPVSERLPDDGDVRFYMCIVENHEEDLPMFCQYEEDRGFGFWRDYYDGDTLGFIDSEFQTNEELGYEKVVAWMPLPEPYRESEPHKQTNADRIRNMSDKELAEFLCKVKSDYQWMEHEFPSEEEHSEWEEWLQSEAD